MSNAEFENETTNNQINEEQVSSSISENTASEVAPAAVESAPAQETVEAGTTAQVEPEMSSEEFAKKEEESRLLAAEKQKQFDAAFEKLKAAHASGTTIDVVIKDRIRGGLRVMFEDIPIFLPTSHFTSRRSPSEEELAQAIGTTVKVHIHELTEDQDNRKTVIVSRKKAITEEAWDKIKVGDVVEGIVSSIASFGIFLDLGGIEGLIHISRLSQVHITDTKNFAQKGDKMKAVVIEVDREKNRIALSKKDLETSCWSGIEAKYPAGSKVMGTVRRFTDFGAYVEVEPGVDGLLRIGELSWTKRIKHPSEVLTLNAQIETEVLSISEEKNTMHLSLKKLMPNPWQELKDKFEIGREFNAIVKQVMTQGCVLSIEGEVDGFMPRSKMRQLARGKKIPYEVGESVEILISDVLPEQESVIIEPKLSEADIAPVEQPRERREDRPQGERRRQDRGDRQPKPDHSVDVNAPSEGSFAFLDLLSDKAKKELFNN